MPHHLALSEARALVVRSFCIRLWISLLFEFQFYWRKFDRYQFFIFIISLIQLFVISFGDVRSFLVGENSLIPDSWIFLKDKANSKIVSIIFIAGLCLLVWWLDQKRRSKELRDLTIAVQKFGIPTVERELNNLVNRSLRSKHALSDCVRASLFLPVRTGFFQWRLKMICRTSNILPKELDALFRLNEGVLGHTFIRAKIIGSKRCHIDSLDVSGASVLPSSYVELSSDNRNLIDSNIQFVTVFIFRYQEAITGLLAIDTTDPDDLIALQNGDLHSGATEWLRSQGQAMELLWRMANNV